MIWLHVQLCTERGTKKHNLCERAATICWCQLKFLLELLHVRRDFVLCSVRTPGTSTVEVKFALILVGQQNYETLRQGEGKLQKSHPKQMCFPSLLLVHLGLYQCISILPLHKAGVSCPAQESGQRLVLLELFPNDLVKQVTVRRHLQTVQRCSRGDKTMSLAEGLVM